MKTQELDFSKALGIYEAKLKILTAMLHSELTATEGLKTFDYEDIGLDKDPFTFAQKTLLRDGLIEKEGWGLSVTNKGYEWLQREMLLLNIVG